MPQAQQPPKGANGKPTLMSTNTWPPERWTGVIVLGSLGMLILLRMGFRGVSVMGASVSV